VGESIRGVRDGEGGNELLLEIRMAGRLYMLDPAGQPLRLGPLIPVEQRNPGTVAGGIPHRDHPIQIAVRDHSEQHGVLGADEAAEGPRQHDPIDPLDPQLPHQQLDPRVEGGLGELNSPVCPVE